MTYLLLQTLALLLTCADNCPLHRAPPSPTHRTGLFDGPVALASALLAYGSSSDAGAEALAAGLGDALVSLLVSSREGPLLEVSPAGVTQLLEGLLQLVAPDCEGPGLLLGSNNSSGRGRRGGGGSSGIVPALLMLLGERHLGALAAWREAGGSGGPAGRGRVAALVALVCEVLSAPLLAGGCWWGVTLVPRGDEGERCVRCCVAFRWGTSLQCSSVAAGKPADQVAAADAHKSCVALQLHAWKSSQVIRRKQAELQ